MHVPRTVGGQALAKRHRALLIGLFQLVTHDIWRVTPAWTAQRGDSV